MPNFTPAPYEDEQLHPLAFLRTQQPAQPAPRPARRTAAKRAANPKPAARIALNSEPEPSPAAPATNPRSSRRQRCCCAPTSTDLAPLLYTVEQAAELLALPSNWLQRAAGERRIPATYIGKYLRFCNSDLDELIAAARRRPEAAFDPRLDT